MDAWTLEAFLQRSVRFTPRSLLVFLSLPRAAEERLCVGEVLDGTLEAALKKER